MNNETPKTMGSRWAVGVVAAIASAGLAVPTALADPYEPPGEPQAVITGPTKITTKRSFIDVTFEFTSTQDNSTFECDIVRGQTPTGFPPDLQPCTSPATFTIKTPHLKHRKKSSESFGFFVRVTRGSQVGQVDSTSLTVVHKPRPRG